jgi:hypothetical protein
VLLSSLCEPFQLSRGSNERQPQIVAVQPPGAKCNPDEQMFMQPKLLAKGLHLRSTRRGGLLLILPTSKDLPGAGSASSDDKRMLLNFKRC